MSYVKEVKEKRTCQSSDSVGNALDRLDWETRVLSMALSETTWFLRVVKVTEVSRVARRRRDETYAEKTVPSPIELQWQ